MCVQQKLEEGQLFWAQDFVGLWDCTIEKNGHEPLNTVPSFPGSLTWPKLTFSQFWNQKSKLKSKQGRALSRGLGAPPLPLSASDGFWFPWLCLQHPPPPLLPPSSQGLLCISFPFQPCKDAGHWFKAHCHPEWPHPKIFNSIKSEKTVSQ